MGERLDQNNELLLDNNACLSPRNKGLDDVFRVIDTNPRIDMIRADLTNMAPNVYLALYSSKKFLGFGGCTLTDKEYRRLKKAYLGKLLFFELKK